MLAAITILVPEQHTFDHTQANKVHAHYTTTIMYAAGRPSCQVRQEWWKGAAAAAAAARGQDDAAGNGVSSDVADLLNDVREGHEVRTAVG